MKPNPQAADAGRKQRQPGSDEPPPEPVPGQDDPNPQPVEPPGPSTGEEPRTHQPLALCQRIPALTGTLLADST
jgi:hypothetical protein